MSNCRECMGTGGIGRLETCSECKGTGKINDSTVEPIPVAEVVSGYSGDPDSRGAKQLKELNLDGCSVGAKLYAEVPELAALQAVIGKQEAEIKRLKLVEEAWKLQKDMPTAVAELMNENERLMAEVECLKKITNFPDAVACVFDNLKIAAANTSNRAWDDQLEEFAEDVIEYAPEYKKQWLDICKLQADLRSANADKEAYAQNAIDLRQRLDNAIELLYESPVAHSRIEKLILK